MSRHTVEPAPTQKLPQRASTLEGYLRVVDHKVNERLLLIPLAFYKVQIEFVTTFRWTEVQERE